MKKLFIGALSLALLSGGLLSCGNKEDDNKGNNNNNNNDDDKNKTIESITVVNDYKEFTVAVGEDFYVDSSYYKISPSGLSAKQKKVKVEIVEGSDIFKDNDGIFLALKEGVATFKIYSAVKPEIYDTFKVTAKNTFFERTGSYMSFDLEHENKDDGWYVTSSSEATGDLIIKDISSTKWYAESTFSITSVSSTELFPKIGFFTIADSDNTQYLKNRAYYFLNDEITEAGISEWDKLGLCEVAGDAGWAWNQGVNNATARHSESVYTTPTKITYNTEFKLGYARDGLRYYLWFNDTYAGCFDILEDLIPADVPSKVGLFQFNSNVTFKNYSATQVSEEVDAKINSITEEKVPFSNWAED
ncbi:MAG TPA: hypothetical protein DEA28_03305 [Firmicutes bacterium]|nr:hypothetical protein [Bacillota bacterium]